MSFLHNNNLIKIGLLYCSLVAFFEMPNTIALYAIIPFIFCYCFQKYKLYYENRYIVIYSCLVLCILFSCFVSSFIAETIAELKALFGTIMMCYIVSCLSIDKEKRSFLYLLWITYYIGMLMYIPQMDVYKNFDFSSERLNDQKLNANTIAYHTFYLTYSIYILGELVRNISIKNICRYSFFLMIPLSIAAALITGSRQVLIIQVPLILLLLYTRYFTGTLSAKVLLVCIIVLPVTIYVGTPKVLELYNSSVLASRYKNSVKKDSRTDLLKDAIEIGRQNPILGVGPGNYIKYSIYNQFSHCTYTELFVNCGIVALFFYLYMLWVFLKKQYQYYKETRDKFFIVFFEFGIIFAIDNFFFVFYYSLWLLPYFFLVASHSEYYYRELIYNNYEDSAYSHVSYRGRG